MHRPSRRSARMCLSILLLATACGGGGGGGSGDASPGDTSPTSTERFDELVAYARTELARQGVPGASIAVVIDGKVAHSAGLGTKRAGADDPVHPETTFGLGSTTKMMVATALMSLREQGTIDLDAPVTTYVPEFRLADSFAARTGEITLRRLLTHTSGLPDGFKARCGQGLSQFYTTARPPLWSDPGLLYDYSNVGYGLAGLALERASGQPFAAAMRDRVFARAGMTTTTFEAAEAMARDHALGHVAAKDGTLTPVELESNGCGYMMPAGSQTYTTAPELAGFAAALLRGGELLGPDTTAELFRTPVETHEFPGERYGMGLEALDQAPERVLYHGGNDERFTSSVAIVPGRKFAVVVLMNSTNGAPTFIAAKALQLFVGTDAGLVLPHVLAHEQTVPASALPRYAGTYADPLGMGRVAVTIQGDKLGFTLLDLPGTPRGTGTSYGGDAFVFKSAALSLEGVIYFWFGGDPDHAAKLVTRSGIFTRTE